MRRPALSRASELELFVGATLASPSSFAAGIRAWRKSGEASLAPTEEDRDRAVTSAFLHPRPLFCTQANGSNHQAPDRAGNPRRGARAEDVRSVWITN